jgi:hypothetical protein
MNHVSKNVGGIYETFKSVEQNGDVYAPVPRALQQQAVSFLHSQLFETPYWLLNKDILNKINSPNSNENIINTQGGVLHYLLSSSLMFRMEKIAERYGPSTYSPDGLVTDLEKGIWKEIATHAAIDPYRRDLQKEFVQYLIELMNPPQPTMPANLPRGFTVMFGGNITNTDIPSIARAHLVALRKHILAAAPLTADRLSRYHLQDVAERIKQALEPK